MGEIALFNAKRQIIKELFVEMDQFSKGLPAEETIKTDMEAGFTAGYRLAVGTMRKFALERKLITEEEMPK